MKDIKETLIKLNNTGIVEVTTIYENGERTTKNVDFNQLIKTMITSVNDEAVTSIITNTGILPNHDKAGISTIGYKKYNNNTEAYTLLVKRRRCDITYGSTIFKNVGIPNLVCTIKVSEGSMRTMNICAVKDDRITKNTLIYAYPFSNVSSRDGAVCFGHNGIHNFHYDNIENLFSIPLMFLSMPNNDDMYGNNRSGLSYREFLMLLENEDFDDNFLLPANRKLGEWLSY